jgi:hypothetical protein
MGIMMLPGICCCDAWQKWPLWQTEQMNVAGASLRDQVSFNDFQRSSLCILSMYTLN